MQTQWNHIYQHCFSRLMLVSEPGAETWGWVIFKTQVSLILRGFYAVLVLCYLQKGAFNPKCTRSMFHAKVLDQWQSAALYWFRLKVCEKVCAWRWGEIISINAPLLFCLSSTARFSNKLIGSVFLSCPSPNALVQFCCRLELVICSGKQNYPFAAFKATHFVLFIWKEDFCETV